METVPFILKAAGKADLDFLLLSDHDTLLPLDEQGEQWHGRTLLLVGLEITPRHNHFLAYGVTRPISPHLPPHEYTAAVAEQGGVGFLLHPHELGSPVLGQNRYTWEDWSVSAYNGLEIWNFMSQWVGSCRTWPQTLLSLVSWRSVRAPYPETLALWDRLGQDRRVVGFGGVDAHGIKIRLPVLGWEIVTHPYEKSFRTVRTHLLLQTPFSKDVAVDRLAVMEALREGACYVADHRHGDPTGFSFYGRAGERWLFMGEEWAHRQRGEVWFSVRVPTQHDRRRPTIRVLRDGAVIKETRDFDLQAADQGPGVYRVEVWRGTGGWIFSNPIYLRG